MDMKKPKEYQFLLLYPCSSVFICDSQDFCPYPGRTSSPVTASLIGVGAGESPTRPGRM
jgi:hypothetical protein